MLVLIPDLNNAFLSNPLPTKNSDVLQQLNHLFDRFIEGKQPYTRVESILWKPFPVYMPLHWLPIGIGKVLNIDVRWGGFIVFVLIYLYSLFLISKKQEIGLKMIRIFQLIMSSGLTIALFFFYRKYREKIHVFDFLLASVGLYLVFFYCTAPFAYAYYWMGFHSYLWIVALRITYRYKMKYSTITEIAS